MASKGSSKGQQALYTKYKTNNSHSINKKRRMARHLKVHPNDEQTRKAMKGEVVYTRNNRKDGISNKKDIEENNKLSIGKRKVYDSKGFIIKNGKFKGAQIDSIKDQFTNLGINNGRSFRNRIA